MHMRLAFVAMLLVGCSATDVCIAGTTNACLCPTGAVGAQSCLPDGSGYGPCSCVDYDGGAGMWDAAVDATIESDAGRLANDASAEFDAGLLSDAAVPPDSGRSEDSGPDPACPAGYVTDPVTGDCYIRVPRSVGSGSGCDLLHEPLHWSAYEDEVRLRGLLGPLGNAGTGLVRNWSTGAWEWWDGRPGPTRIGWPPGHPDPVRYTFLRADGIVSTHAQPTDYFCMRSPG